ARRHQSDGRPDRRAARQGDGDAVPPLYGRPGARVGSGQRGGARRRAGSGRRAVARRDRRVEPSLPRDRQDQQQPVVEPVEGQHVRQPRFADPSHRQRRHARGRSCVPGEAQAGLPWTPPQLRRRTGPVTFRYYRDLKPTFTDRSQWALPTVLRHQAAQRPDAVWLDVPEEGLTWTYAEMLASAERVGRQFLAHGATKGDRVVIVAANSSRFVRTWVGTAVSGLVEVPINTAYEHDFLAHQVRTVEAKFAVIDDVYAERFVAVQEAAKDITKFWIIDTGEQDKAIKVLREAGWEAAPWDELEADLPAGSDVELPEVYPHDLASVFFTSGTTGPSKGVAMPHAQMYFFADECVSLVRLTADDAWMTVTPLFHGNAQFMAAYPTMVAGARTVIRPRFSASRWIDQIRESRVTVTNFIGVMMDFIWKQDRREDDADNPLRVVFAAPTAATLVEPMKERYGIEAFVEVFGLTETSAPIISPYGESRPAGAAGLAADDWFDVRLVDPETDEEVPVGQIG